MSFYGGLQSIAAQLLNVYGQSISFSRTNDSAADPVTGAVSTTTTAYSGFGIATSYADSEIDGVTIQRGDVKLVVESTTTVPEIGDSAAFDGRTYRIMDVMKTSPGGTVTHYTLQARK